MFQKLSHREIRPMCGRPLLEPQMDPLYLHEDWRQ